MMKCATSFGSATGSKAPQGDNVYIPITSAGFMCGASLPHSHFNRQALHACTACLCMATCAPTPPPRPPHLTLLAYIRHPVTAACCAGGATRPTAYGAAIRGTGPSGAASATGCITLVTSTLSSDSVLSIKCSSAPRTEKQRGLSTAHRAGERGLDEHSEVDYCC